MACELPPGEFSPGGDEVSRSGHARAAAADADTDRRLHHAIGDLFLPEAARLDERTRATIHHLLAGIVAGAEAEMRRHAARLLTARGAIRAAETLLGGPPVLARLTDAGLLRDPELMEELIARVELDLLFDALPPSVATPDRASLLVRWADAPDGVVADASLALMAADNRRRGASAGTGPIRNELPAELHQRLLWWVAAALRDQATESDGMAERDRALADATLRSLGAHDEGDRSEAVAARLANAVDAQAGELGPLLVEAVADRRAALFVALLARAGGIDQEQVRHLTVDPRGDLLILLLHAVGVERDRIARIGVALAGADSRRDLDRLADAIDWAVAHDPRQARAALAPLALNRDFRAAVRLLARGR
ncbi:MAG TPA: DUF2336 domain-containing protein [Sphingomonas sp.]|jgi:hypothetical protein|uniref:DUF2336 domain-containing protein n=1 Tax=Sphingomonas sp. TaxID=28214 RepID=UPI002ED81F93